jgi:hypothetical protein
MGFADDMIEMVIINSSLEIIRIRNGTHRCRSYWSFESSSGDFRVNHLAKDDFGNKVHNEFAPFLKNIHMATQYPFASQPQNRHCFGKHGEKVEPCPDFPCIHTPCDDPDYLADLEEARLKESEADRKRRTRDSSSKEAQEYRVLWPFDPTPVSETERKEFESKFDRCRRLDIGRKGIAKAHHRCSIEMILAEYKFDLEQWEDKDSDEYQQAIACRDQILGTFNPETGDYSWMWFEDGF